MASVDVAQRINIAVVYSPRAGVVDEVALSLPEGTTVRAAIDASGLRARHPDIDLSAQAVGVWSKRRALDDVLRDLDRVELYRPLTVDPKEARRLRYRQHLDKFKSRG